MARYGFLGLGIMGSPMAANLVRAGHEVVVWNRTGAKAEPLEALGAAVAASPRDVVRSCPITFAMLADPAAAEEVCFGEGGVLEGVGEDAGYVDMSTVDPETSLKIAAAVREREGRFLEAPVSGTKKPAEDGTLVILAAGDPRLYQEALPALEIMGKKILHLGEVGNGARMKLVVNMIMAQMMVGLCEGMALGEKAGLDTEQILEALGAGALANPMFQIKGGMIRKADFTTSFPLKHMQKDLRLALGMGDEQEQPLAGAAAVNETFKRARALGFAEEDFSAVFKAIESTKR